MIGSAQISSPEVQRLLGAPLAAALVTVVAVVDYSVGSDTLLVGLAAAAPAIAALTSGSRSVAAVGAYAVLAILALAGPDHLWHSHAQLAYFLLATIIVTVVSAMAAGTRQRRQHDAAFLAEIVRSSNDAVIGKSVDGTIVSWNAAAEHMYGWTAEEAAGRHISLIVPPDHRAETERVIREVAAGERVSSRITKRVAKDGTELDVSLSASPIRSAQGHIVGIAAVGRDVTEQLRRASAAADVAARKAAILEGALDAIITIDSAGVILEANPAACVMTGWAEAEMLGRELAGLMLPEESREAHRQGLAVHRHTGDSPMLGARLELTALRRDGSRFPVEVTITRVDIPGAPVFTGYLRDLTARAAAAADARRLEDRLRQKERLDALGQLATGVAHDFNNQLGVILNYAGLVQENLPRGQDRDDVAAIIASAERAAGLTRQLLTFGRGGEVSRGSADTVAAVTEVSAILHRILPASIDVVTHLASGTWPVACDPITLDQVLMNLAVNARDAMPDGGTLTLTTRNLRLDELGAGEPKELAPGKYVELTVTDTGTGMSQDTVNHAFDPFFTTKAPGEGTGLGLASVYGIARQAGGDVTLYSEPDRGTSVRVFLPAVGDAPTTEPGGAMPKPTVAGGAVVLLVEDEELLREALVRTLERADVKVHAAGSAEEALLLLSDVRPDLLVSDMSLPGMSGADLAVRLRELLPDVPVLLMSGYAPQTKPAALGDDHSAVMVKPFSGADLVARIGALLRSEQQAGDDG
ncbi:MAG: two-component system, cell cycle sensor histidine kinase and response regulator CckA [Actinomycetota bacterium]|jgi:PAS domain S-box-containing protein|nr:two-component system, cell cycle sensor histidine kinase and response regulator CckA [Actinomycetota bacterium]